MAARKTEYAKLGGVDYTLLEPFKESMVKVAKATVLFPNKRDVVVEQNVLHSHGGVYGYVGNQPHLWCKTLEGLGNKSWISAYMRLLHPNGPTYMDCVAYCNAMMWVNDNIAQGALPVVCCDEVIAGDSEWFADPRNAADFAQGLYEVCQDSGMALVAGESPVYKFLVKARDPVKSAAIFGGCVTGIIAPARRLIRGDKMGPGDRIIAIGSSGIHSNGIGQVIGRVMGDSEHGIPALPDTFDTRLPSGMTIGEAVHIRTLCYVPLVERLLQNEVPIHAFLPATGDGVGKLAFDKRRFRYKIHSWLPVPELFLYMRELGVSLLDCLKTFNWGAGYYVFVAAEHVQAVLDAAAVTGFSAMEVGIVEDDERCTIFGPENDLRLPPPGQ
jgi:phosphoribosylformylglycinamidine cyclo-ligase